MLSGAKALDTAARAGQSSPLRSQRGPLLDFHPAHDLIRTRVAGTDNQSISFREAGGVLTDSFLDVGILCHDDRVGSGAWPLGDLRL